MRDLMITELLFPCLFALGVHTWHNLVSRFGSVRERLILCSAKPNWIKVMHHNCKLIPIWFSINDKERDILLTLSH